MKRATMRTVAIAPCVAMLLMGCVGSRMEAEEYNAHIRRADSLYMVGEYAAANEAFTAADLTTPSRIGDRPTNLASAPNPHWAI